MAKPRSITALAIVKKDRPVISVQDIYVTVKDVIMEDDEEVVKVKIEVID